MNYSIANANFRLSQGVSVIGVPSRRSSSSKVSEILRSKFEGTLKLADNSKTVCFYCVASSSSAPVTSDKAHIEHNESAFTLTASVQCDMDLLRNGAKADLVRSSARLARATDGIPPSSLRL
jgi:hypothetical protein